MLSVTHVVAPVSVAAFAFVLLRVAFSWWVHGAKHRAERARLPPGPRAIPFLGNVHQLPMDYQERTFAEWAKQYGDVVYAKLFQRPVLVLSSLRAAQDLLEKKSSKYSDRPRLILLAELMGWDNVITHLPYGDRFRKHRRWMHDNFQSKAALLGYRPVQRRETYTMLAGLLESPVEFIEHVHRWAVGTIMEITYGHRIHSMQDEYVKLARDATVETVIAGSPGSMLVDFFPILKEIPVWAPGAGFKRNAFRVRGLVRALMDMPYNMVKTALASGNARPCFTASLLEDVYARNGITPEEEEDIKGAAGVIYAAGTDTTITVMSTFFLAMVLHPEAFKKAQQELDVVIGRSRLPDDTDRENLPYLECLLKEVYRWQCPVPLAIPHNLMEDDEYRGYHIAANTMVIPNIWQMTQDSSVYPEPQKFRPERWQEMDPQTADLANPRRIVFGFGRRVCPGRDFADAGVWLAIASVIALFDIGKSIDAWGNEITPPPEFVSGFVSHPKPFVCAIRPRAGNAADIIAQARAALPI
ncbi:cytochrome P450 [Trametes versicolor FP-101664 SS1]|nr:cytochrome P450 [Trametes versicolor FP-101664 SS1]EIW56861.1 cytochrome P450 [Trametes versicolor FP-101664 SS1]